MKIEPTPDTKHLQRQDELPEARISQQSADPMLLDDTKHTIFIHDIDRELIDDDAPRGVINFLPGVTETLMPMPKSLVINTEPQSNELVLYREPKSLSIPMEEDNVRRAIVETWARARGKQSSLGSLSTTDHSSKGNHGKSQSNNKETRYHNGSDGGDDDFMDIDSVS